jgi:hypothetical protein
VIQELTHECRAGRVSGAVAVIGTEVGIEDKVRWRLTQVILGVHQAVGLTQFHQRRPNGIVRWRKRW